jgi:predicted phosphodiesterase
MRVAALYDVHGNLPALEAALTAARERGADAIVFGGDLAWGPLPAETVAAIRAVDGARFVRGNADREVAGALERVAEMLAGVGEPVVVCGHTHAQFDRVVGATRVVNAGSVGLPFGAPGAHWAVLGPDVELVVTPYDTAAAGAAFLAAGGPEAADFAEHAAQPPPESTAAELYG